MIAALIVTLCPVVAFAQTRSECDVLKELNQRTLRDLDAESLPARFAKWRALAETNMALRDKLSRCYHDSFIMIQGITCEAEITAVNRSGEELDFTEQQLKNRREMIKDQLATNRLIHPC
jgi:hypothetical protein